MTSIGTSLSLKLLRALALVFGLAWAGLFGYAEFILDDITSGTQNPEVIARMERCIGTFQQRYDCRQKILLEDNRKSASELIASVLLVFGPPVALGFLVGWAGSRFDRPLVPRDARRHNVKTDSPFKASRVRHEE